MQSKRGRLDRFLSVALHINRKHVRLLLAQGRVIVNGDPAKDIALPINEFSHIVYDGQVLQCISPIYVMLHKPTGVVSATKDDKHTCVVDLLDDQLKKQVHLVGRLDLNTSGLLLLTNDSRWSEALMLPEAKVTKEYWVTLANPLTSEYVKAFAEGMYFGYEGITTKPAELEIVGSHRAKVTLREGRYHQIKRMFGRFRNPVIELHRHQIGSLTLDPRLQPGQSRRLTQQELQALDVPFAHSS